MFEVAHDADGNVWEGVIVVDADGFAVWYVDLSRCFHRFHRLPVSINAASPSTSRAALTARRVCQSTRHPVGSPRKTEFV
jgi:hypothetical protein